MDTALQEIRERIVAANAAKSGRSRRTESEALDEERFIRAGHIRVEFAYAARVRTRAYERRGRIGQNGSPYPPFRCPRADNTVPVVRGNEIVPISVGRLLRTVSLFKVRPTDS